MRGDSIVVEAHHVKAASGIVKLVLPLIEAHPGKYTITIAGNPAAASRRRRPRLRRAGGRGQDLSDPPAGRLFRLPAKDQRPHAPRGHHLGRPAGGALGSPEATISKPFGRRVPAIEKPLVIYEEDRVTSERLDTATPRWPSPKAPTRRLLSNVDTRVFIDRDYCRPVPTATSGGETRPSWTRLSTRSSPSSTRSFPRTSRWPSSSSTTTTRCQRKVRRLTTRMRVAFLNPQGNFDPADSYWTAHPDFGGQLVYVKEVALALTELGVDVDIVTRRIRDPEWPEFASDIEHYDGFRGQPENSPYPLRRRCFPRQGGAVAAHGRVRRKPARVLRRRAARLSHRALCRWRLLRGVAAAQDGSRFQLYRALLGRAERWTSSV